VSKFTQHLFVKNFIDLQISAGLIRPAPFYSEEILRSKKVRDSLKMKSYFLSPSTLNIFVECPRCFWLKLNEKLSRPQQPSSTLPRGMDLLIKDYFDTYRSKNELPPELVGKLKGGLFSNLELLNRWRNWQSGLRFKDETLGGSVLFGALDDCIVEDGLYIPLDYKTRGFDLKEDSTSYYLNQISFYSLLLEKNGYRTTSFGYLVFYILKELSENGMAKFEITVIKIDTDINKSYSIFKNAVEILNGPIPSMNTKCTFCQWAKNTSQLNPEAALDNQDLFR
jgi:hypothetical protein